MKKRAKPKPLRGLRTGEIHVGCKGEILIVQRNRTTKWQCNKCRRVVRSIEPFA